MGGLVFNVVYIHLFLHYGLNMLLYSLYGLLRWLTPKRKLPE